MKTVIFRLVFACLGLLLIGCVLAQSLQAQTIISFDSSPDKTMVMKIQDPGLSEKPNKLILIFDSASITYDFSKEGEIALLTTSTSSGQTSTNFYVTAYPTQLIDSNSEEKIEQLIHGTLGDNDEPEEALDIEAWMMQPEEWSN